MFSCCINPESVWYLGDWNTEQRENASQIKYTAEWRYSPQLLKTTISAVTYPHTAFTDEVLSIIAKYCYFYFLSEFSEVPKRFEEYTYLNIKYLPKKELKTIISITSQQHDVFKSKAINIVVEYLKETPEYSIEPLVHGIP